VLIFLLVVSGPGVAHFEASSRRQSIFDEQRGKLIDYHHNLFLQIFCQEFVACLTVFKILLEKQPAARLKNFQLTVRKTC